MYQNWALWDFLQSPVKHLLLAITGNRILNQMDHQSVLREWFLMQYQHLN